MIKSSKESTKESFNRIKDGQTGAYKPIKTRYEHFNTLSHGGITKQKIYSLGALSSFGKSHILRNIEEDIFNEQLNPNSKEEVVLCKVDWEMQKEEMILARVHSKTGVDYSELMFSTPTEDVKNAFNEVYLELNSDHIYETFDTYKPDNFYNDVREFTDQHQDKKQIVLTIDNINLVDTENSDESTAIAKLITHLIRLKREVKNLSIIILCQLNRQLKERINPKEHFPRTSDFYFSSKIEHASDIQIVVHNPYLLGIDSYGAVNYQRYEYLSQYLEEKNKYAVFRTKGLTFWHYVKIRLKNSLKDFRDLYIEEVFEVDKDDTEINKNVSAAPSFPNFNSTSTIPVFEDTPVKVTPYSNLKDAFDSPNKEDQEPF